RISELTAQNSQLAVDKQIMQPKAFVDWLLSKKYIYRDQKSKLMPYEGKNNGLFEVKECFNEKTQWGGVQTLIT
ncbi:phage antirepressor KilAC domain-containing protein, partial [Acinetobacter baumannii]|nr:phage antirepressor KilAC domain-containing protein [Acinetobacter baumannii]